MENSRGICPITRRLAAILLNQQVIDNPHQSAIKLIKNSLAAFESEVFNCYISNSDMPITPFNGVCTS